MSDAQDYLDQSVYGGAQQIWDPKLGQNVLLTGQSPIEYIRAHPESYTGYTGAVTHVANNPIHADAYSPGATGITTKPGPTGFNTRDYQLTQERRDINPYNETSRAAADDAIRQFVQTVRMIPGTRPDIGVLPGGGFAYLGGEEGGGFGDLLTEDDYRKYGIDPLTQRFGAVAARGPVTPTFAEAQAQGLKVSGRGYHYHGTPDAAEQELERRFAAGDGRAGQELAKRRQGRIDVNDLSTIQQYGQKYYAPAIMAAPSIAFGGAGAVYGPILGAGWGAMSSGAMTRWKDPAAVAIGAGAGAVGGWGAGKGAQALGFGPVAQGAASGAGGALTQTAAQQGYTGDFDPARIARNVGFGAAAGAAGSAITQAATPSDWPTNTPPPPSARFAGAGAQSGVSNVLNNVWPSANVASDRRRRNPYA